MSVQAQSLLPSEIIIADDGSSGETAELIKDFKKKSPVVIKHIWHPDEGFQLSAIRNKGIAACTQPYIVQVDGDLILHRHFIADHLQFQKKDFFVTGSRVLLSAPTSTGLIENESLDVAKYATGNHNFFNKFRNGLLRDLLATRYKIKGRHEYYVKGCNMAFWKKNLLAVNGYNESFVGWGKEDSELAIRLINAGTKKLFLKMGGISYHLHHKEASRESEATNVSFMNESIQQKRKWADRGLSQHL
jgi:glycosyltransferase involved in cell wall biosynthesis